jgi:hypothetical protein
MGRTEAEAALKSMLQTSRKLGQTKHSELNLWVARNTFEEEIGRFGDDHLVDYGLDERKRDLLIAHGRQDVAHALCNTIHILDEIELLKKRSRRFETATLLLLLVVTYQVLAASGTLQIILDNYKALFRSLTSW